MTTVSTSEARPGPAALTPGRRPEFAAACAEVRSGLQDAVNLAVVADGLRRRDEPDPRSTLHRLTAFLSVRAWERFVRDVRRISVRGASDPAGERAGCLRSPAGPAGHVLAAASGGRLPGDWRIAFPLTGTGTRLTFEPETLTGDDEDLSAAVDWWVCARHGLPHRRLPRDAAWPVPTDAYDSDGRDVGPTTARFALTLFLQIIDQSIRVLADEAGMARAGELWLPGHWLEGRAGADPDAAALWSGPTVSRQR